MALLSWNEIRARAIKFSKEWEGETSESAEAKSFWDSFFNVFGISRRRVATFEKSVKKAGGEQGFVDLLWKGILLVEHKSKGKDLEKAYNQAKDYFPGLKESELPRYILVSDFENFVLYDLDEDGERRFKLNQFPQNIELFGFIAGYQKQEIREQNPVNIHAAEKMGELHDKLKMVGYAGHDLEVFLVRLLFCLFADDTGIFEKNLFRDYIEEETREDGHDLGFYLAGLFETLNTPVESRAKNIDENLNKFPYVNGSLFAERLGIATFDFEMRELLLESAALDWGLISPAVFGSLFQSVMDVEQRRTLGAHYTSEENILKVIKPLFLDDLWDEFEKIKNIKTRREEKLNEFHEKLASLRFLDPACGCGNFLIISYRELRLLELEVIREILRGQMTLNIDLWVKVDVDQFYGIEIDEFASQIAQVALWLIDHQMNMKVSNEFGEYFVRLPLRKKPHIVHGNALLLDWDSVVPKKELNYILGNPPFVGSSLMTKEQKEDLKQVTKVIPKAGSLDFVTGWYIKSSDYIRGTKIKVGLVSTNSVVQGEQAIVIWRYLMYQKDVEIHFAHQTFQWNNEAKGKAAVFCVIIGFSSMGGLPKTLFSYPNIKGEPTSKSVDMINQYLLEAPTIFIDVRRKPLSDVPPMIYGTKPVDGGQFIFTEEEKEDFIQKEPLSEKYLRPWIGSHEMVNGYQRYCLYLADCPPQELRKMPYVRERIEAVRRMRAESKKAATQKWADYPTRFIEDRTMDEDILIVPSHTSENRKFIPIGYFEHGTIASNAVFQVIDPDKYIFGILNSSMHMAWTRTVCGRLKGDYRYSNTLVYNNFIFPEPTEKQKSDIGKKAQKILDVRSKYTDSTFADLYDPLITPPDLLKAHQELDKLVEKTYGKTFKTDEERVAFLFEKYKEKKYRRELNSSNRKS
ncbi:class I SAM-dependent DNA methyltransferase [Priestia filamentosa]|uniref:class I SAM-dependent DNA methyltransferase n=1 Tax=Priestia filamentosa TaxID=1402861 RepID=UPI001FB4B41C|nr:DNA methyltransferase [Priestia filamentosa]UOE62942.1 class I SAM-dependent DNA methyltransferase [Priestia filamentosa]